LAIDYCNKMRLSLFRKSWYVGVRHFSLNRICTRQFTAKMGAHPKISLEWMVMTLRNKDTPQNAISSNPKPCKQRSLEEVFNVLDRDKKGVIEPHDLVNGFKKYCRIVVSDEIIEEIMDKVDLDKNGSIDFEELEILMETFECEREWKNYGMSEKRLEQIQKKYAGSFSDPDYAPKPPSPDHKEVDTNNQSMSSGGKDLGAQVEELCVQLEHLSELRDKGILSDDEFTRAKAKVLG